MTNDAALAANDEALPQMTAALAANEEALLQMTAALAANDEALPQMTGKKQLQLFFTKSKRGIFRHGTRGFRVSH